MREIITLLMRYVLKEPKNPPPASRTEKSFSFVFPFAFSRQLLIHQAVFLIVFSSSKLVSRFPPGPMFSFFLSMRAKSCNMMPCLLRQRSPRGFPQSPHTTWPSSLLNSLLSASSSALKTSGSLHLVGSPCVWSCHIHVTFVVS